MEYYVGTKKSHFRRLFNDREKIYTIIFKKIKQDTRVYNVLF